MANPEHLAILEQGVEVWNAWRQRAPEVHPDLRKTSLYKKDLERINLQRTDLLQSDLRGSILSNADLTHAHLLEVNLRGADLRGANLKKADLYWSDMIGANMRGAILQGADLRLANLREANLTGANCREADLREARLIETNFTGAILEKANLEHAVLLNTLFVNNDLSMTLGLEKSRHEGPSTVDHRTLIQSIDLPVVFLRGCGLSDLDIASYARLHADPVTQYYSCFISYSTKNTDFAHKLHDNFQDAGVRCWFAPEDLKIGDRLRPAIHDAIRLHDKLLLILSEHAVGSQWVEDEVERAMEKERQDGSTVLFPIRLDNAVLKSEKGWASYLKRTRHIGDFSQWQDAERYDVAFHRLLRDLKAT